MPNQFPRQSSHVPGGQMNTVDIQKHENSKAPLDAADHTYNNVFAAVDELIKFS